MKKFTPKISTALNLAGSLHEGQERKGDGLPYIVHPFAVALILMDYSEDEDVIVASLLHDTVEDTDYTEEQLSEDFGPHVATLVMSVTEPNKDDPWQKRKNDYLAHLKTASYEAKLICAADKIHNLQSMEAAYRLHGKDTDKHFNAPPDKKLWFYEKCLVICKNEPKMPNGIIKDFEWALHCVKREIANTMMIDHPAKIIEYRDYDKNVTLTCPACSWSDTAENGVMETFNDLFHIECPECEKMLLIVEYPLASGLQD